MGLFSKKEKVPAPAAAAAPEQQSWDDRLKEALPTQAQYFDAFRTEAFNNSNLVQNFIEFWEAQRVNGDKWRIMHYMVFDLDQMDGKFKAEVASKEDCSFPEAVYHIAKFDSMGSAGQTRAPVEMTEEKYPADKYPELQQYFFAVENFRVAANIEGIAFDNAGFPYRRVEGKVVATATFSREEINKSILAVEQARDNGVVKAKMENGVLSDIFHSTSTRRATLDKILEVGQVLPALDDFAKHMGAFYLGAQRACGIDEKFDKIQSLTQEEKDSCYQNAQSALPYTSKDKYVSCLLDNVLPQATACLEKAKSLGIHVEPFEKDVAECALYANLLSASQALQKMEQGLAHPGGTGSEVIANIRQSVNAAQKKFIDLGGSIEQADRLQAWVANPKKDPIPEWLPRFLDRYYDQRQKALQKVAARQAGLEEIKTMSVKVKPPLPQ